MDSTIEKNKYTDEQIAEFWLWYNKAEPYSEDDWINMEFDGEMDPDRLDASVAKDILTELGLLEE